MNVIGTVIDRRFRIERSLNSKNTLFLGIDLRTKNPVVVSLGKRLLDLKGGCLAKVIQTGDFAGEPYFIREWVDGIPFDEKVASGINYKELALIMKEVFNLFLGNDGEFDLKAKDILVDKKGKPHILKINKGSSYASLADLYFLGLTGEKPPAEIKTPSEENVFIKKDRDLVSYKQADQLYFNLMRKTKSLSSLKKDLISTSKYLKKEKRRPIIFLILFLVAVSALVFGYFFFKEDPSKNSTAPQKETLAPKLVGLKLNAARKKSSALGLSLVVRKKEGRRGFIVGQIPLKGEKTSGTVVIWVGTGPKKIIMPDLLEIDREKARQILQEMGLVASYERIPSDYRPGLVLKTDPKKGKVLKKEDTVLLYVAAPNGLPKIPNVIGLSLSQAKEKAYKLGVGVRLFREVVSEVYPPGQIIRQRPAPGTRPISKTVKVWVAIPPPPIPMPDVLGLSLSSAEDELLGQDITYSVYEKKSNAIPGTVIYQIPAAGENIRNKSAKIWVSR